MKRNGLIGYYPKKVGVFFNVIMKRQLETYI